MDDQEKENKVLKETNKKLRNLTLSIGDEKKETESNKKIKKLEKKVEKMMAANALIRSKSRVSSYYAKENKQLKAECVRLHGKIKNLQIINEDCNQRCIDAELELDFRTEDLKEEKKKAAEAHALWSAMRKELSQAKKEIKDLQVKLASADTTCRICLDNESKYVAGCCGGARVCLGCYEKVTDQREPECPFCRSKKFSLLRSIKA